MVVQKQGQRNAQKSVVRVQSCCFAIKTYCFFDLLVTIRVVKIIIIKLIIIIIIVIIMPLFNEGNTKQQKANKLVALSFVGS